MKEYNKGIVSFNDINETLKKIRNLEAKPQIHIGDKVMIGEYLDPIEATVIQISISDAIQYNVAYWKDKTRLTCWVYLSEILEELD